MLTVKQISFFFNQFFINGWTSEFDFFLMYIDINERNKIHQFVSEETLLGRVGHFWSENYGSSQFWICYEDFLKLLHNEMGQQVN